MTTIEVNTDGITIDAMPVTTESSGMTGSGYKVPLFMGCYKYCWVEDIYPVSDPCMVLVLNICLPGVGTMI